MLLIFCHDCQNGIWIGEDKLNCSYCFKSYRIAPCTGCKQLLVGSFASTLYCCSCSRSISPDFVPLNKPRLFQYEGDPQELKPLPASQIVHLISKEEELHGLSISMADVQLQHGCDESIDGYKIQTRKGMFLGSKVSLAHYTQKDAVALLNGLEKSRQGFHHPNVVSLMGIVFEERKHKFWVMSEENTTTMMLLEHQMEKIRDGARALNTAEIYTILKGVVNGLQYLHYCKQAYRYLKPRNIWISESLSPKLCALGFLNSEESDLYYSAPETSSSFAADVFSLGCVVYELCTTNRPCLTQLPLEIQPNAIIPSSLVKLIYNMTKPDPTSRPHLKEILHQLNQNIF